MEEKDIKNCCDILTINYHSPDRIIAYCRKNSKSWLLCEGMCEHWRPRFKKRLIGYVVNNEH